MNINTNFNYKNNFCTNNKNVLFILFFFITAYCLQSQTVELYNIDAESLYPKVKANFLAFDKDNNPISNLSASDLIITENGKPRNIIYVTCPELKPKERISVALSMDISISMEEADFPEKPFELSKIAAKALVNGFKWPEPETALQTCDSTAKIIQNYTINKFNIINSITNLEINGGNDYSEQLFNPQNGLLPLANRGKYKKIAVIFTDSWADALPDNEVQKYIEYCKDNGIIFYGFIFAKTDFKPEGVVKSLKEIAEATGGILYQGITTSKEAEKAGIELNEEIQNIKSCEISWQSGINCNSSYTKVELQVKNNGSKTSSGYNTKGNQIVDLQFSPEQIIFDKAKYNYNNKLDVQVSAIYSDIYITRITSSNPDFKINTQSFALFNGESKLLTITFNPQKYGFSSTIFNFENDLCNFHLYVNGYVDDSLEQSNTLKLTSPNGGEIFLAGNDTVITWKGIPETDECLIEYSTDSGLNWRTITSHATGLSYKWKNIPNTVSNYCLVRIKHIINNQLEKYDISDNIFKITSPLIEASDIFMGKWVIGSIRDSIFSGYFVNTGLFDCRIDTVYFIGNNSNSFKINNITFPISVKYKKNYNCTFSLIPEKTGFLEAVIVIVSQSDTLYYKIYGEGVNPVIGIVNNNIDFGKVKVGKQKDSLYTATLINIGTDPLRIFKTVHTFNNFENFKILDKGGSCVLQTGDTAKIDLRFKPQEKGKLTGNLTVYSDGVGSPTNIQLTGEGVEFDYKIAYQPVEFPVIICENSTQSILKLSNPGIYSVNILDYKTEGYNFEDFSIQDFKPFAIAPGETKDLIIIFNPKTNGSRQTYLRLKTDIIPDSVLVIQLYAKKDAVILKPEVNNINLGNLCPNEQKDSTVLIKNSGTIAAVSNITFTENLNSDINKFELQPDKSLVFNFNFKGLGEEGDFSEEIIITDSLCGTVNEVFITGKIQTPAMEISDISITSLIEKPKEKNLSIVNNSERDFTITDISGIKPPFELMGNKLPLLVKAGQKSEIIIKYTPEDISEDNISVLIEAQPCSLSKIIQITGLPYSSRFVLEIPEISSNIGEVIEIPVYLKDKENLESSGVTAVNLKIQFNPGLLLPLDYTVNKSDSKTAEIFLENLNVNVAKGEPIAKFKCKTALGNTETCGLTITNVETIGGKSDVVIINGKFSLLGICYEGGPRLVNPDGETLISAVRPNPANEEAEFDIETIENGLTQIYMTNLFGEKVIVFNDSEIQKGKYNFKINTLKLNSGIYFIILQTPTIKTSKRLFILK